MRRIITIADRTSDIVMRRLSLLLLLTVFTVATNAQKARWQAGTVISDSQLKTLDTDKCFTSEKINDELFARINGKSWKTYCTLQRDDLRYIKVLHKNADGKTQRGELIVNRDVADDVLFVFRELYKADYKIERMVLIDDYDADDEKSMAANNTSSFNFRFVTGSKKVISNHGKGKAIDINPLYNPYVKGDVVSPSEGRKYAYNRNKDIPYLIDKNDLAYKLFTKCGWRWGGNYKSLKDYQHFEKE